LSSKEAIIASQPRRVPSDAWNDIFIQPGNFSFGFPVAACIVLSILLTILLNLFRR
jgi:hypothetical protein